MRIKEAVLEEFEIAFSFCENLWESIDYDKICMKEVFERTLKDTNSFIYFLLDGESYVGFCHGSFFDTFWMSGQTCYLSSLIVKEPERKKGYGKMMVNHVKTLAIERGCRAIILDSAFHREDAHLFYEHYGFTKCCYGFEYLFK